MDDFKVFTVDPVHFPAQQFGSFVEGLLGTDRHFGTSTTLLVRLRRCRSPGRGFPCLSWGASADRGPRRQDRGGLQHVPARPRRQRVHPIRCHGGTRRCSHVICGRQGVAEARQLPRLDAPQHHRVLVVANSRVSRRGEWPCAGARFCQRAFTGWLLLQIKFSGLWIDMNEPSSFCDGRCSLVPDNDPNRFGCYCPDPQEVSSLNTPPFLPGGADARACRVQAIYDSGGGLDCGTISMTTEQHGGLHYNLHNLFGHLESVATAAALTAATGGQRPFVITRSTFPGTGAHVGHWLGAQGRVVRWDDVEVANSPS